MTRQSRTALDFWSAGRRLRNLNVENYICIRLSSL